MTDGTWTFGENTSDCADATPIQDNDNVGGGGEGNDNVGGGGEGNDKDLSAASHFGMKGAVALSFVMWGVVFYN